MAEYLQAFSKRMRSCFAAFLSGLLRPSLSFPLIQAFAPSLYFSFAIQQWFDVRFIVFRPRVWSGFGIAVPFVLRPWNQRVTWHLRHHWFFSRQRQWSSFAWFQSRKRRRQSQGWGFKAWMIFLSSSWMKMLRDWTVPFVLRPWKQRVTWHLRQCSLNNFPSPAAMVFICLISKVESDVVIPGLRIQGSNEDIFLSSSWDCCMLMDCSSFQNCSFKRCMLPATCGILRLCQTEARSVSLFLDLKKPCKEDDRVPHPLHSGKFTQFQFSLRN